jgi:hypothetical protein
VSEVRTFRAYLKDSDEEVEIIISDSGENARAGRYSASAQVVEDPDRVTASNPEKSIRMALAGVHWDELKRHS